MKYDFTSIIDRRGKDASSADRLGMAPGFSPEPPQPGFDAISMWVADMNFATCPAIPEAMIERAKHPLYGYFFPRDEYFESIIRWRTTRDGYQDLKREYIGYENGVHGCVSSAVQTFSAPGDKILLHSPVYVGFTNDVEGLGRTSIYSALKKDENGVWRMDFEDVRLWVKHKNGLNGGRGGVWSAKGRERAKKGRLTRFFMMLKRNKGGNVASWRNAGLQYFFALFGAILSRWGDWMLWHWCSV